MLTKTCFYSLEVSIYWPGDGPKVAKKSKLNLYILSGVRLVYLSQLRLFSCELTLSQDVGGLVFHLGNTVLCYGLDTCVKTQDNYTYHCN